MKSHRYSLALFAFASVLAVSPLVLADDIYDNGPINPSLGYWSIYGSFVTSDSFDITDGSNKITGIAFGAWLTPGDTLQSVEISITDQPMGGHVFFDQQVSIQQAQCDLNKSGYNVCLENATFDGPTLGNDEYWLNLTNAKTANGDPAYWDENSGFGCQFPGCPSDAYHSGVGTIPSEAFTVLGTRLEGGSPEPATLVLFSSGLLGVIGFARRKLL